MRILSRETAALFVDFQERLLPVIHEGEEVTRRSAMLLRGLNALEVPVVFPRQYPKGLGDIVPEIKEAALPYTPMDKLSFSALGEEEIGYQFRALRAQGRKTVLVCGVEAHVCVLQSAIDLKDRGFHVVLVTDCTGSRYPLDKKIALKRAVQEGIYLTTAESILFELTERAGTDVFKVISKLVK